MKVTRHVHYRLVLAEVGYPISELSGTRELFEATRDALKGTYRGLDFDMCILIVFFSSHY